MKRTWRWWCVVASIGLLAACGQQTAQLVPDAEALARSGSVEQVFPLVPAPVQEAGGMVNETPAAWFVQFASAPSVEGGSASVRASERHQGRRHGYRHRLSTTPTSAAALVPGCRVANGYDFVGDTFNANTSSLGYDPVPSPDPRPDDCHGHGTHVAGIVGANGDVTGVAPGVTFGAYRVFGCAADVSTTADIMIAAMERALADGMHILNMSIGSAFNTWPQHPTAKASDVLVDNGMIVVASIGNNGASGVYSAGSPGVGTKVIGVASYDNSHIALNAFSISPDDTLIGYGNAAGAPPAPTSGSLPMARTGTTTTPDDACAPIAADLTGHAVLIRRGDCTFHTKALNAMNAGAAAVVLYNNVAGRFSPTVAGDPAITIPVVAISDAEGALIDGRLATGPVTLTWTDDTLESVNPTGGLISSFSSYGLNAELDLKPDIGAPGGLIRSTYPIENGTYATSSGTSMSAPHVAGGAALVLEARPGTSPLDMRTILQNSADPKNWWGNPGLGFLDNVHRQGAGMLDVPGAATATTLITPGKLALGESEAGPQTRRLTVQNSGNSAVTYDLSFVNALSTGGSTFSPGFFLGNASVAFSSSSVTVPPGGSANVDVTITPAASPSLGQYGGYIVLTPQGGGQTYRVPYAGFIGDYQARPVLTSGGFGFPLLGWSPDGVNFGVAGAGDVFTLQGQDVPYLLVHLDHHARRFRVEVFDDRGRQMHRAYDEQYLPRNSTSTGFFAFAFDGTTRNGNRLNVLRNGTYTMKISVLKALGDDANPAHWETWTSPSFVIARP
jgi:minor extracellular serine protease Vpr